MDADLFWTIVSVAVILGIGAVSGFVGFYWFVVIPTKVLGHSGGSSRPPSYDGTSRR